MLGFQFGLAWFPNLAWIDFVAWLDYVAGNEK
jgi:hypothetical protein